MNVELKWEYVDGALGSDPESSWKDKAGFYPSALSKYVDKTYFHPSKGHLYKVVGITYQSEDDRWMLAYQRISSGGLRTGPLFNHKPEDFTREGRFLEVKK